MKLLFCLKYLLVGFLFLNIPPFLQINWGGIEIDKKEEMFKYALNFNSYWIKLKKKIQM